MNNQNLIILHDYNAGFFSCCSVALEKIITYYNIYQKIPNEVDMSNLFYLYKVIPLNDISHFFFEKNILYKFSYSNKIKMNTLGDEAQFSNYKLLHFTDIHPFIEKYFSPSLFLQEKIRYLEIKYNIDYSNSYCGVFYRGNDKSIETNQPSYNDMIKKARSLQEKNPSIIFIIQTDEYQFLQEFKKNFPNTIQFMEIPVIQKSMTTIAKQYANDTINKQNIIYYYVSVLFILSKCKNIIMTSGNGELFIALFRNNADGIIQYLNRKEYIYGVKNNFYDPEQKDFWCS